MTRKISLAVAALLGAITFYWIALPTSEAEPAPAHTPMTRGEPEPSAPRLPFPRAAKATAAAQAPTATATPQDEADRAEDEAMAAADNTPEQRLWRITWSTERQDDAWTQRMHDEVQRVARSALQRDLKYYDLSCRETVCRVYLQFTDQLDARAFINAPRDAGPHYEFQSMDPEYTGEGYDRSDFTYELLVVRERPDGLPVSAPREPAEEDAVIAQQTSETPEGLNPGEVIVRARQPMP